MIEYSEDTAILRVKQVWEKVPKTNAIRSVAISKSIKEGAKTNNDDKPITYFKKWVMPPQPQAYIKYPRFDFL